MYLEHSVLADKKQNFGNHLFSFLFILLQYFL